MSDPWDNDEIAVYGEPESVTIRFENEPSTYMVDLTWSETNVLADKLKKAIDERPEAENG